MWQEYKGAMGLVKAVKLVSPHKKKARGVKTQEHNFNLHEREKSHIMNLV
jgi:hypothetical protein